MGAGRSWGKVGHDDKREIRGRRSANDADLNDPQAPLVERISHPFGT